MLKVFTELDFQKEVIEASKTKPVLVDFYATWCGPCQLMLPLVDALAQEIGDKAVVGKIDSQYENAVSEKYDIMSVPTVIIFKDGQPAETIVGLQSKDSLKKALEKYI